MKKSRKSIFAIAGGGFIILLLILNFEITHSETQSPDGRYIAVVKRKWITSVIPMMPGQGSDASGSITIYEIDSRKSLGRHKLDMVWMANDLEWGGDGARIKLVAEWEF